MKLTAILIATVWMVSLTGCESIKQRTDNATVQTGMRFDEDGRLTDEPKVTVPIWNSRGLKAKSREVTPARK